MKKKLLFANKYSFTKEQFDSLNNLDLDVIFLDGIDQQSYDMDFSDIDAVVCFKFFDFNDITKFKSLKFIHTTSTGIDQMPVQYLKDNGIILKNCPGVHSAPISEYVVGAVLEIYKHTFKLRQQQEKHIWECDWNLFELMDKRICILSTGSIGSGCAQRFKGFETVISGIDPYPKNNGCFDEIHTMEDMDEELSKADIVVNCLPLFENTRHLINKHSFDMMKDTAIFVNVSRGPVVDTQALLETLESGKFMGAVIDVFEQEPLPADSKLWDIERLIITPHNSFVGEGNNDRVFSLIYNDLKEWLESLEA